MQKICFFTSISGRFLWLNEYGVKITRRNHEKDFMINDNDNDNNFMINDNVVYELLEFNINNSFLVENLKSFMEKKDEIFQFSTEVFLVNGGKGVGKYDFKRIDTKEGIPLLYHIEITPISLSQDLIDLQ